LTNTAIPDDSGGRDRGLSNGRKPFRIRGFEDFKFANTIMPLHDFLVSSLILC
jgi:hypothetical protein